MAAPNITVVTEPEESARIVYLAMAPTSQGAPRRGQLALRLTMDQTWRPHSTDLRCG